MEQTLLLLLLLLWLVVVVVVHVIVVVTVIVVPFSRKSSSSHPTAVQIFLAASLSLFLNSTRAVRRRILEQAWPVSGKEFGTFYSGVIKSGLPLDEGH